MQLTLFGEWELVREWGRIGQAGQVRPTLYAEQEGAAAAFDRELRRSMRCGQRRIIGRFLLLGRNPAPGEGGCASGKALRGDPAARSAAQAERRKLGGSALPRAEGSALSPF